MLLLTQVQKHILLMVAPLVSGILLIGWVLAQWIMSYLASWLVNQGVEPLITFVGQVLFAIVTLVPITFIILKDVYTMFLHLRKEINKANQREDEYNRNIMLEYRAAELEGILDWALTNNLLVQDIKPNKIEEIQQQALEQVRRRHPEVHLQLKGEWTL